MEGLLANEKLILFAVFVCPGLVSMQVYRLLMPAKAIEWTTAIVEALFYSFVNFVLCFPILLGLSWKDFSFLHAHPIWFSLGVLIVLLVGPLLWPFLFVSAIRSKRLMKHLQLPYPTAWDAFFDRRQPCFLLVHLNDGSMVGGYFGDGSYASAFPNDGDLYINAVYQLDEDGRFGQPVPDTRGVLLRKADYVYIEIFDIPPIQEANHEQRQTNASGQGESEPPA